MRYFAIREEVALKYIGTEPKASANKIKTEKN